MFHIALCDDDARQIQLTHKLLDNYLSLRGVAAKIWEFSNGQALLNAMYDETFDLYLLDIVMPEMDGIDLGMELRKSDENGVIIYLTTSPDFALQGYQTKAASYLLIPSAVFTIMLCSRRSEIALSASSSARNNSFSRTGLSR